ncbi:MAG: hypothetical protein WDN45_10140 [Caulobacteraceae bacterium]
MREHLPAQHLLSYLDAILRVYNRLSRRDNIHKQRIKNTWSTPWAWRNSPAWSRADWAQADTRPRPTCPDTELARIRARFPRARVRGPAGLLRGAGGRPSWPIRSSPASPGATCIRTRRRATPSSTSR